MSKTKRTLDRYDLEIEDIKAAIERGEDEEEVIHKHWTDHADLGGLFSYCSPSRGRHFDVPMEGICGCLTQIKFSRRFHSADLNLTKAIRRSSLPGEDRQVGIRHLSQFARWQRKMDAMWPGRGEMQMPEGFEERLRKANS